MPQRCRLPAARKKGAFDAKIWQEAGMLDRFDLALLNLVQKDDSLTADQLAARVALSSSAIARRLRRLRQEGWIARTVALLGERLGERRIRAIVFVTLSEHADHRGKALLLQRIGSAAQVQFCYELAGTWDLLLLFDCATMGEFNEVAERVLVADATVHRYETSFVKRQVKFEPFVPLDEASIGG
jgi:Lrp/AsnC family transcriptional regulator, leucine-responsive regulatory protein